MGIDKCLMGVVCCANCQGDFLEKSDKLVCNNCGCIYRIKDNILVLISSELENQLRG